MQHINIIETKSDEELVEIYGQFLDAEKVAAFSNDNELGRIREKYEKDFGANTTLLLQIELTHVIADRWYKEHTSDNRK